MLARIEGAVNLKIIDLRADDIALIREVAELLIEGFKQAAPAAWPDLESALTEVRESFGQDRISRVAFDDEPGAVGWIGGIRHYNGHAWEIHPMVVRSDSRGRG